MFKRFRTFLLASLVLWGTSTLAEAVTIIDVGTGDQTSHVSIAFYDDGVFPKYQFNISYNTGELETGIDLIQYLDTTLTEFNAIIQDFGFGDFVDGIAYDDYGNAGFGGGELWWHYWTRDDANDPWNESMIGSADRFISNGSWDGWVYGSALNPTAVPEPASVMLLLAGVGAMTLRRRRA